MLPLSFLTDKDEVENTGVNFNQLAEFQVQLEALKSQIASFEVQIEELSTMVYSDEPEQTVG